MPILDKKMLLNDIEERLNEYIPANTVRRIVADAGEAMERYEVTILPDDGGPGGRDETNQILKMFLDAAEIEGKAPSTIEQYRYQLTRLFDDTKIPATKMTVYHIRSYLMAEMERGNSKATIKSRCHVFNRFFTWLRDENIISTNPMTTIGTIRAKPEERYPFTKEDLQMIREEVADDPKVTAMIYLLLSTGCRVSELISINRNDVDFQNMRISVTGKGSKTRWVYFDEVTAMMIRRYLRTRNDIRPELFSSRLKRRYTKAAVEEMCRSLDRKLHIPGGIYPHRFRHTFATTLLERGMSIEEISVLMGHCKIDTTMTYAKVNQRNVEFSYRKHAAM